MPKKTAQSPKAKPRGAPAKNPAAQALALLRWKGTTPEERTRYAQRIAKLGWQGESRVRRRKAGGGSHGGGRPQSLERCPCGAMTAARAAKRGHKCVGSTTARAS